MNGFSYNENLFNRGNESLNSALSCLKKTINDMRTITFSNEYKNNLLNIQKIITFELDILEDDCFKKLEDIIFVDIRNTKREIAGVNNTSLNNVSLNSYDRIKETYNNQIAQQQSRLQRVVWAGNEDEIAELEISIKKLEIEKILLLISAAEGELKSLPVGSPQHEIAKVMGYKGELLNQLKKYEIRYIKEVYDKLGLKLNDENKICNRSEFDKIEVKYNESIAKVKATTDHYRQNNANDYSREKILEGEELLKKLEIEKAIRLIYLADEEINKLEKIQESWDPFLGGSFTEQQSQLWHDCFDYKRKMLDQLKQYDSELIRAVYSGLDIKLDVQTENDVCDVTFLEQLAKTGATVLMAAEKFVEGTMQFVEEVGDGCLVIAGHVSYVALSVIGLEETGEEVLKGVYDVASVDITGNVSSLFWNSEVGQIINDKSYFEHDSNEMNLAKDVGYVVSNKIFSSKIPVLGLVSSAGKTGQTYGKLVNEGKVDFSVTDAFITQTVSMGTSAITLINPDFGSSKIGKKLEEINPKLLEYATQYLKATPGIVKRYTDEYYKSGKKWDTAAKNMGGSFAKFVVSPFVGEIGKNWNDNDENTGGSFVKFVVSPFVGDGKGKEYVSNVIFGAMDESLSKNTSYLDNIYNKIEAQVLTTAKSEASKFIINSINP